MTGGIHWLGLIQAVAVSLGVLFQWLPDAVAGDPVKVLTDRTPSHLDPLFEQFTKTTGIKVSVVHLDQALVERLQARPLEPDLVITKDAELLETARSRGLLAVHGSKKIEERIPREFRDESGAYFVDAYRARTIIYSKERVKPADLSTYADLGSKRWQKRLCVRSGYHEYNLSLFGQMIVVAGEEKTRDLMASWSRNLAREPKGGDRDQAKAIMEGKCDVGIMNSYYYPLMLQNDEKKVWGDAIGVFLPNQSDGGTFIMRSGLALTNSRVRRADALELLEHFASEEGQRLLANLTFQFPTNPLVKPNEALKALGAGQPGIKDGQFQIRFVSLQEIAKNRETVVKILNEVKFDRP
jgi:iron(III) transport system substrate-binding protein